MSTPQTSSNELIIEGVSKRFGEVRALDQVSLKVEAGELFGLIGPDGAGKTTLIRILNTLMLPDEGQVTVAGWDVRRDYRAIRRSVGYMPGRFSLYYDLSVEENLRFFATVFGTSIEANYDLIRDIYVQIEPFRKRRAGKLSGGMKQKLALSCALIHRPTVLFLDEPTTGVDAVSRRELWEMLRKLRTFGITIFVSTPYMDEASLCDRVALIQHGQILTVDHPQRIVDQYRHPLLAVRSSRMYQLIQDLRRFGQTHSAFPFGEYVHLALKAPVSPEAVGSFLTSQGHTDIDIRAAQATIEDCFMDIASSAVFSK